MYIRDVESSDQADERRLAPVIRRIWWKHGRDQNTTARRDRLDRLPHLRHLASLLVPGKGDQAGTDAEQGKERYGGAPHERRRQLGFGDADENQTANHD